MEATFRTGKSKLRRGVLVASGEHSRLSSEPNDKGQLMYHINHFRAEVCTKLKGTHGEKFDSFTACKHFMEEVCQEEAHKETDYCKEYFQEQEAEKELKELEGEEEFDNDMKKVEEESVPGGISSNEPPATPAAPAPASLPDSKTEPPASVSAGAPAAAAPASQPPGLATAPASAAAATAPYTPGKSMGEPNSIDDDEQWYFKNGGKDEGRLHMDGSLKLPAQGYWGKLVEHDDQKSVTSDWGSEFGPASKHRSYASICKDFPDNAWCKRHHAPHTDHRHSSAYRTSAPVISLLTLVAAWVINFV